MTPSTQDARATGLVELAVRCEQAAGADRELDAAIWCAVNGMRFEGETDASGFTFYNPLWRGPCWQQRIAYTASLDAAMTLVPEGHDTQMNLYAGREGGGACVVSPLKRIGLPRVYAATPALALTAACLSALAASTKDQNDDG